MSITKRRRNTTAESICMMGREGIILIHKNIKGNDFASFLNLVGPYRHSLTVDCECCHNW